MSTPTTNYNLPKPQLTDDKSQTIGIDIPNAFTIIDNQMRENEDKGNDNGSNFSDHIATSKVDAHTTNNSKNLSQNTGSNLTQALDGMKSRIDSLSAGSGLDQELGVYKSADNTNTNDYETTLTGVTLVDGFRLNLETANPNTGASTLNLNGGGVKDIIWLGGNVEYALTTGMMDGVNELQWDTGRDKWKLLTRDGVKTSNLITQQQPITQVGGDTYKDLVVDGFNEIVVDGQSWVNLADNGVDYVNHVIAGAGTTKGADGIHLVQAGGSEYDRLPIVLSNSKQYTLIYLVTDDTGSATLALTGDGTVIDSDIALNKNKGLRKQLFTTSATVTGTYLELRKTSGVSGDYTDYEILAILEGDQTLDTSIQSELDLGINNVNGDMSVVGKNKFDKNSDEIVYGERISQGSLSNVVDKSLFRTKQRIQPNKTYKFSGFTPPEFRYRLTDFSGAYIQGSFNSSDVLTPSNAYYIEYSSSILDKDTLQLELGTTATDYKAYNKTTISLPEDLKSLPNDVVDTYNVNTGEVVRNAFPIDKSAEVFDGTEAWGSYTNGNGSNSDLSKISLSGFVTDNNLIDGQGLGIDDYAIGYDGLGTYRAVSVSSALLTENGILNFSGALLIYVPTTELPSDDLAGFKSYLGTNNLNLICQLDEPIQEQHESQQFLLTKGGTIEQTSAVVGEVEYTVNLNQPAQVNSNSEAISRLGNEIDAVADYIGTVKLDTGTADNIVVGLEYEPLTNDLFTIVVANANTGACTIKINENDAIPLEKIVAGTETALTASDLVANEMYMARKIADKVLVKL